MSSLNGGLKFLVNIVGITVSTKGEENVPTNAATVLMYSHASNADPFVLKGYAPVSPKFVFKSSLLYTMPFVFIPALLYGHIPIDRKNRPAAIEALRKASQSIAKYQRSVCIAPEGTRSTDGKLQEFKKGPFHLSMGAGVPIIPVVLFNNFDMWPPKQFTPFCGEIRMQFLPQIVPQQEDTIDTLSEKVHSVMKAELEKGNVVPQETGDRVFTALLFLLIEALIIYGIWYWVKILFG